MPQSEATRDSLAKALYGRMFRWIVAKINAAMAVKVAEPTDGSESDGSESGSSTSGWSSVSSASSYGSAQRVLSIGVLDIFGFEVMQVNSFEQFCINLANETLQKYFNDHIFRMEQEDYRREEIAWVPVTYSDNEECLRLLYKVRPPLRLQVELVKLNGMVRAERGRGGRGGRVGRGAWGVGLGAFQDKLSLMSLLDDESSFPSATDDTLVNKFHQRHAANPAYEKFQRNASAFAVNHYAGQVVYTSKGFLEKNSDVLNDTVLDLFIQTANPYLSEWFAKDLQRLSLRGTVKRGYRPATVGGQFRVRPMQEGTRGWGVSGGWSAGEGVRTPPIL